MIRAIVFDLDGTLIDRAAAHRRYCEDLMERYPDVFPINRRDDDLALLNMPFVSIRASRHSFSRFAAFQFPALGLSPHQIAEDYARRIARFVEPDPAVTELVRDLAGRYSVAILTNGSSRVQRAKLARSGLADVIGAVFISGETRLRKPRPEAFRQVLEEIGCRPGEALMVGNNPIEDISGAIGAGMRTCFLAVNYRQIMLRSECSYPDWIIDRIGELPRVLPR